METLTQPTKSLSPPENGITLSSPVKSGPDMQIVIRRKVESHNYMRDYASPPSWSNNDANNMLDQFSLFRGEELLLSCQVQTVANMLGLKAGTSYLHTILPGDFFIKPFVEKRSFKCIPHGIVGAKTMQGHKITSDSVTESSLDRWLMHDKRNFQGVTTRVAWSDGCFVFGVDEFARLNEILADYGYHKSHKRIPCTLSEIQTGVKR